MGTRTIERTLNVATVLVCGAIAIVVLDRLQIFSAKVQTSSGTLRLRSGLEAALRSRRSHRHSP